MDAELDALSTLANETCYTLVRVLVATREALCVCELHAVVDLTESDVAVRDVPLDDPDGVAPERVREIRDEVERRVPALFDERAAEP